MAEHTPGPLRRDRGTILDQDGRLFLVNEVSLPTGNHPRDREATENARRLVALWNACKGLDTGDLERIAALGSRNTEGRMLALERLARAYTPPAPAPPEE